MKKATKSILKIVISIIYILWGLWSPISAFEAVLELNIPALITAGVGVLMLLAGIFGLIGMKKIKCRVFGIIIFVFSLVGVVTALPSINVTTLVTAVLSWLFIVCI